MSNYTTKAQYTKKLTTNFVNYSLKSQAKQDDFLRTLNVFNKSTGQVCSVASDFMQKNRDDYLWLVFQSVYMQNQMDDDMVCIFLTASLPSEYHPFTSVHKNGKEIKNYYNKRFNPELQGNKLFTEFWREVYNNFKVGRKRVKLQYQKVIEPHKSFVPHLHALLYVPKAHAEALCYHIEKQIKNFKLGKQYKIERIKDIKKSSAYLLKYIRKNLDGTDKTTAHVVNGWKKTNRIRVYTHSQLTMPKYIFQKLSRVIQPKVEKGENILQVIEDICDISIQYKEFNNALGHYDYREKEIIGKCPEYKVHVNIDVSKNILPYDEIVQQDYQEALVYKDFYHIMNLDYFDKQLFYTFVLEFDNLEELIFIDMDKFDFNKGFFNLYSNAELLEYWHEFILYYSDREKKKYKIKEFEIIKIETNEILYKKSDWSVL